MKIITIKDIANACGISTAVASAALRNKKGTISYSKETQERVQQAAKELGYVPNPVAQNLKSGQNNAVALMFSLVDAIDIPNKISSLFWENEKKPSIISRTGADEIIEIQLKNYLQQRIAGIALELSPPFKKEIVELITQLKALTLVTSKEVDIDTDLIVWDRTEAIRDAVDHFIKTGRKNPALLCAPLSNETKMNAFDMQLEKHGFNSEQHHIFPDDGRSLALADTAYNLLNEHFLDTSFPFDSLVCSNDELAIASIYWLKEKGLKVPEDVAVIGFNNSGHAKYLFPPLASVERKHGQVAETIYNLLSSRMKQPEQPRRTVTIPMEFIWRESAG